MAIPSGLARVIAEIRQHHTGSLRRDAAEATAFGGARVAIVATTPDQALDDALGSAAERALLETLAEMLASPTYLFPLAAAQRQYRQHYYGLSSAALLEDLFYDALSNYLAQFRPAVRFERPERGQKGWDYRFEGLPVSHKVGLKPQPIAVLWDATVRATEWSFESPVVFVCSGYRPPTGPMSSDAQSRGVRPVTGDPGEVVKANHRVWLVRWPSDGDAEILWTTCAESDATLAEVAHFDAVWTVVAEHLRSGGAANELELLRSASRDASANRFDEVGTPVDLAFKFRSGINFFPRASLQHVPVTSNNRALLMSAETVEEKMQEAVDNDRFVPMPLWFALYAGTRPPDVFLAQLAEYEALFSPAGRRQQQAREGTGTV